MKRGKRRRKGDKNSLNPSLRRRETGKGNFLKSLGGRDI
jgi:hypothetical protein